MSIGMIIGCRLCLCTDPRKSFTFLDFTEQEKSLNTELLTFRQSMDSKSMMVKTVVGLELDFSKLDIFPNHVCEICWHEVQRLDQFQKMAQRNEKFIVQCQEDIKSVGLLKAKENFDMSPVQSPEIATFKEEEDSLQWEPVNDRCQRELGIHDREPKFLTNMGQQEPEKSQESHGEIEI